MVMLGHVRNGMIVADDPMQLPEGASVRIEIIGDDSVAQSASPTSALKRQGGWWRGQVVIADNFDELPDDMADALGMRPSHHTRPCTPS